MAEKLNKSKGPIKVLIPTKGWSSVDWPGNPTYDPGEDMIFAEELGKFLKPAIEVRTIPANLEETAFARELLAACAEIFGAKGSEPAFLEGVIR